MNTERLQAVGEEAKKLRLESGSETKAYKDAIKAIDEETVWLKKDNPDKFWQLSDATYQAMCADWARSRQIRAFGDVLKT